MAKALLRLSLFVKKYLPLAFTKTKYCEIIRKEYTLSYDEAVADAYNELVCRIENSLDEGVVITDISKSATPLKDGSFMASVRVECIEDIAQSLPIEVVAE